MSDQKPEPIDGNNLLTTLMESELPTIIMRSRSRSLVGIVGVTSSSNFSSQDAINEENEINDESPPTVYHNDEETKLPRKRRTSIRNPLSFSLLLENTGSVARDHVRICESIVSTIY